MFCLDILNTIGHYLHFSDMINLKFVNKSFYNVKISIKNSLIVKINEIYGFDLHHDFAKGLLDIIIKNKELSISGSILLQVINNENYENSDLDIYYDLTHDVPNYPNCDGTWIDVKKTLGRDYFCTSNFIKYSDDGEEIFESREPTNIDNENSYVKLHNYLSKFGFIDRCGLHHSYRVKDWYNKYFYKGEKKIDLVLMPYNAPHRVDKLRELTCCNNYYDGKTLYIQNLDSILNKWGVFEFYEGILENIESDMCCTKFDTLLSRCDKYYIRGFEIYIPIHLLKIFCENKDIILDEQDIGFSLRSKSYIDQNSYYFYKNKNYPDYVIYEPAIDIA